MRKLFVAALLLASPALAQAETFSVPDGYSCAMIEKPVLRRDKNAQASGTVPAGYRIEMRAVPQCKKERVARK